jgi:hypothetical protein
VQGGEKAAVRCKLYGLRQRAVGPQQIDRQRPGLVGGQRARRLVGHGLQNGAIQLLPVVKAHQRFSSNHRPHAGRRDQIRRIQVADVAAGQLAIRSRLIDKSAPLRREPLPLVPVADQAIGPIKLRPLVGQSRMGGSAGLANCSAGLSAAAGPGQRRLSPLSHCPVPDRTSPDCYSSHCVTADSWGQSAPRPPAADRPRRAG